MATYTATEVFGKSEAGSINKDGTRTVNRIFHVMSSDGSAVSLVNALSATNLPSEPTNGESNATITAGGETLYYWGTRSFQRTQGHDDLWQLTYEYSTSAEPVGDGTGYEYSANVRAVTLGVYRTGVTAPSSDNPPKTDIGGTQVDEGGMKTSITMPQAGVVKKYSNATQPSMGAFAASVGTRNALPFEGAGTGEALFVGVRWTLNSQTNFWEVEEEYSIDTRYKHARQVAKVLPDGNVWLENDGGVNSSATAKHVYWVQPFPTGGWGGGGVRGE